jgi:hypothetical protein
MSKIFMDVLKSHREGIGKVILLKPRTYGQPILPQVVIFVALNDSMSAT